MIGQMAPLYQALMDKKQLILDVVGFADFQTRMQIRSFFGVHIRRYINRFKLGGYKIFLDGSRRAGRPGCRHHMPATERNGAIPL